MKVIVVTGTPGTGKTAVAKKIAQKKGYLYVDVNAIIRKYGLSEGYDKKRKTKLIDVKKLNAALVKEIRLHSKEKGMVIDSHLSHYLPRKLVDVCIVTKCALPVLQRRLKKRHYSSSKIRENLDSEIFGICLNEAKEKGHRVNVVDTTKGIKRASLSPFF